MKNRFLLTIALTAALISAGSGCAFFDEIRGTDKKTVEKEKAKKEKETKEKEENKEVSHIPPEVASGLNDVEKQEMEAVYKKNESDSKATSKRVFGGL
jgi:hypothetical protein